MYAVIVRAKRIFKGRCKDARTQGSGCEAASQPAQPFKKRIAQADNHEPGAPAAEQYRTDNQGVASFH